MSASPPTTNQPAPLVAPLSQFDRQDLALAGGKGANLGELLKAGFNVPPGFVITIAAYDLLLSRGGLQEQIQQALAALEPGDPASVAEVSGRVRAMIQSASLPQQIKDEIIDAYRGLGSVPVAVRSSATAEDLPEAAFAGQQETFLNVIGEEQLFEAVRACWASLWSERAVAYRLHQKVDQRAVKLAVVVQKMVPADVAGVMFTADPVSGARGELVIDASPGLGEAVVAGVVTPDHFVVDKRWRRIKQARPGRREVVIRARAEGGTEQVRPDGKTAAEPALPPAALRKLAGLGLAIERHYGAPQDIEWAWVKGANAGRFFILQARPMTALPEPLKLSGPMRAVIPMLAEMWPARPYPLDLTTFTGALERAVGNLLTVMIGPSAPDPDRVPVEEDGVVVRFQAPELHPSPGMLVAPWLALWRTRRYDPARWEADPLLKEFIARARELDQRDPARLSWAQVIQALREAMALMPRAMELRERYLPQAAVGLGALWLLLRLAGRGDHFAALVSGVKTKTTETNQALETLAARIRSDPALHDLFAAHDAGELRAALEASPAGRAFLQDFETFLDHYGHREASPTISQPAWKDQPEAALGILKVLALGEPGQPDSYAAWERIRDELLADSILRNRLLRGAFLKSLANARALFQIREDTHFYALLLQPPMRRAALELGRRLADAGALDSPEEVFHLRLEELEPLGEPWPPPPATLERIRTLVARRKAKRESLAGKPLFDPRLLGTIRASAGDVLLSGSSGSPGLAAGPARIVLDPSEFGKLQAGDVLVAPVTNPAWTPLFQRAAAVVVDMGGAASHAAIVAREYGIPAVMGTLVGTQQLKDGQQVRVDGSRGLVLKAEGPE